MVNRNTVHDRLTRLTFCGPESVDILYDGTHTDRFPAPCIDTRNTHGTGCTLSSAIAAYLSRGLALPDAVSHAKAFVTATLPRPARSPSAAVTGWHITSMCCGPIKSGNVKSVGPAFARKTDCSAALG